MWLIYGSSCCLLISCVSSLHTYFILYSHCCSIGKRHRVQFGVGKGGDLYQLACINYFTEGLKEIEGSLEEVAGRQVLVYVEFKRCTFHLFSSILDSWACY